MKTNTFTKKLDGRGVRVAVVRARFNEKITDGLLHGCLKGLQECAVQKKNINVVEVPGSFEIPFAANVLAKSEKYDVIIALGAVIKGETKHDEYIANAVAYGITKVSVATGVPVIFGVITPNNLEQAIARAGNNKQNKGYESAMSAIEMVQMMNALR
ncbi:MAG: 6,7-dimethyl-8-ribityllumazine synthase [bacterium]|nr:6,7-dimethyl-8-ribityllumazine synthase [bacterium]